MNTDNVPDWIQAICTTITTVLAIIEVVRSCRKKK